MCNWKNNRVVPCASSFYTSNTDPDSDTGRPSSGLIFYACIRDGHCIHVSSTQKDSLFARVR